MFGQQLHIEKSVASSVREIDGYRISLIVERLDGQPIKQEDAQVVLTNNISTMLTQRMTFGGRS